MSEADFEKLGVFYLGRNYDLIDKQVKSALCLYESRDMATHAVCLGRPGSGKTGLCIGLMEEAAIDSIPVIAIDTKGDVANVLLHFPQLRPEDFQPWVDREKMRRSGLPEAEYAAQQAQTWTTGLSYFEETGARIQRLHNAADFAVYTPGSSAGLPVSLSGAFFVPPPTVLRDGDAFRERVSACASALLALVGINADPTHNRELLLLSTIIKAAWQTGQDLTLPALIRLIQTPTVTQIGALDLEAFYPAKERLELATTLNNLLASLQFDALMDGEPLNIDHVLHGPDGKPRVSVFSIAHLSEPERMFFVSHLLNEVVGWVRSQSSTTSLRAMVYLDEISAYFPAANNPPSKSSLLTLLKQGPTHGLGLLLSSQHPAELDYKGLSPVGTWFIGALQSESDRTHALNGLEAAATASGINIDRPTADATIAALGQRIFLMNNVHDNHPVTFLTRWTLSYLRGPMAPEQIKQLMESRQTAIDSATPGWWVSQTPDQLPSPPVQPRIQNQSTAPRQAASVTATTLATGVATATNTLPPAAQPIAPPIPAPMAPPTAPPAAPTAAPTAAQPTAPPAAPPTAPPTAPTTAPTTAPQAVQNQLTAGLQSPKNPEYFLPVRQALPADTQLVYRPMLIAVGNVHFVEPARAVDSTLQYCLLATPLAGTRTIDWEKAQSAKVWTEDLKSEPELAAKFDEIAPVFLDSRSYPMWTEDFITWLCNAKKLKLLNYEATGDYSKPRETERDFRIRLAQSAREQRDRAAEALKLKYMPYLAQLNERLKQSQQVFVHESQAERDHKVQSALSLGTNILGEYMGRKAADWATHRNLDVSGIAHRTGATKPLERSAKDERDVQQATETIESLSEQMDDLNLEFGVAMADLERKFDPLQAPLLEITIAVAKANVSVPILGLAWAPFFRGGDGQDTPAWIRIAGAK